MRNPPRTLQNSIFEPLYSHPEELHFQPSIPNTQSSSSPSSDNWLSLNPPFSIASPSTQGTIMKRAAATIFNENTRGKESSSDVTATEFAHSITATTKNAQTQHRFLAPCDLGTCSPSGSPSAYTPTSMPPICLPIRSHSAGDVGNPDDGSVASKLLSSITKSISSPSLLSCCKESARETPYQKSLRLKTMKLQYCAEELGSESSERSLHGGDYFNNNNIFDGPNNMSSSQSTRDFSAEYQESESNPAKLISVRSSPNLGCSSLVFKPTSHTKERSFPPPLSHTLPRSTSLDSFSYSLRASREDGRFVLKEFKVPCRQFFQASRKDGRLTLQRLISTDENSETMPAIDEAHINQCRDMEEDDNVGVYAEVCGDVGTFDKVEVELSAKGGSATDNSVEVESAKNKANLVGGLEECIRMKGSKKSVDETGEKNDMKGADQCLLMAKFLSNGDSCSAKLNEKAKFMSLGASKMKSDFKAAKHKTTSKVSCIRSSSNRHLRSSLSNRQPLVHLPGKSRPNLKLGHDSDATKFVQCAENLRLESKPASRISTGRGKTSQGSDAAGYGIGKSPSSSMIILKDHGSLMENVSKLVASCGLDLHVGKGSCEEESWRPEYYKSTYKNGRGIVEMGKGEFGSSCSHELVLFDVKFEDVVDDSTRRCLSDSSLHFGVLIPPSSVDKNRPHSLHCKDIFHRNLAKGALHCAA